MITSANLEIKNKLNEFITALTPRILGFLDRSKKEQSETAGCFDRYYWHYSLHDISNSRFQEAAYLLQFLYNSNELFGFYNNPRILEWLQNSITFWQKTLHIDGSCNEIYPFERSFCATGFSAMIITEILLKQPNLKIDLDALSLTGKWLKKNSNAHISNQMAASAAALYNIFLLTNADHFKAAAEQRIEALLKKFKKNNFFSEYNGFDIGYQTITLSVLTDSTKYSTA